MIQIFVFEADDREMEYEVIKWCMDQFGDCSFRNPQNDRWTFKDRRWCGPGGKLFFEFDYEEDAAFFKLTWGNYVYRYQ